MLRHYPTAEGVCQPCKAECKTCLNATYCLSCNDPKKLYLKGKCLGCLFFFTMNNSYCINNNNLFIFRPMSSRILRQQGQILRAVSPLVQAVQSERRARLSRVRRRFSAERDRIALRESVSERGLLQRAHGPMRDVQRVVVVSRLRQDGQHMHQVRLSDGARPSD